MTDITKCKGGDCPFKERCYRYTSFDNEDCKSYFLKIPFDGARCEMFWGDESQSIYNQLKQIVNGNK